MQLGKEHGKEWREMQQRYPTVRAILRSLGAESQEFDPEDDDADWIKTIILRSLGVLEDQAVLRSKLAPDAPVLAADRMHPWIWEPARPLWEIQQFRQALLAAATAVNAQLQAKVGRRDVSDDKLIQECFGDKVPEPGKARLRVPGDPTAQTVQSRQLGTLHMALGCIKTIRNPAAHDEGEVGEQEAFEQLAAHAA
ncbi:MAG TPA: TIGR02391 family protein [Pseudonocardiaceae bacterium]|nr:TIGR02391 family protein [Pseudonocardiaceae bacterium]